MNHHFFGGEKDIHTYNNFLKEDSGKHVAMVIDPPFGIMVEALWATIAKIQKQWKLQLKGILYMCMCNDSALFDFTPGIK